MAFNFLKIPLDEESPWYSFTVTLTGVSYTFTLRYNIRLDRWMLDIADASETPILSGIPLLIERNLTGQYTALDLPPGVLFVTDDSGRELQPGLLSFLTDHSLNYADPV